MLEIWIIDSSPGRCALTKKLLTENLYKNQENVHISEVAALEHLDSLLEDSAPALAFVSLGAASSEDEGLEAAKLIRGRSRESILIFLSDDNFFAEESYELQAFWYFRRPVKEETFSSVLNRAIRTVTERKTFILTVDREKVAVFFPDILYIETQNRKLIIHTQHGVISCYGSLRHAMGACPPGSMLQISRFEAVSLRWISNITSRSVQLKNGETLILSRKMADKVWDTYHAWKIDMVTSGE